jgi:rhodanese-related sulfurtransferase
VRLVPLFPFNLLNYALGLTQIPLTQYVLASLVCMAPGTLAYAWLGYAGREALADNQSAINYGLIAFALLAAVALLPRLIRRLRGDRELQWIEIELLASWLKDGASVILIDVRGPDEFTGPLGHLPHALNLPVGTLPDRLTEIKVSGEQPIVVVCRTDKRSAKAAIILREAGFRDVRVLRGGMEQWNSRGMVASIQAPS